MASPTKTLLELAEISHRAAKVALEIRSKISLELKGDGSIVTEADRATELFLREVLPQWMPGTTVSGEEFGYTSPGENGVWVIDPIDGTSNFSYGSPLWGVSIGLVRDNLPILGAVFLPDLNETFLGEKGGGAFRNGKPLMPIPPAPIRPEELVSYCEWVLPYYSPEVIPGKQRCVGAAVIDATWVACQRYRGLIGVREKLHDLAASLVINSELGADIRYANGEPLLIEPLLDGRQVDSPWITFPQGSSFGLS